MADVVLDGVEVVGFLPKQNADAVFQNMVVPLRRVNASQGRISLYNDIHVLAGPGEQLGVRIRPSKFEQWRLIADTTPSSGQNEKLLPFAGQKVTASGKVFQRGGSSALVIEKIEAVSGQK